jgi:hypothetical protein
MRARSMPARTRTSSGWTDAESGRGLGRHERPASSRSWRSGAHGPNASPSLKSRSASSASSRTVISSWTGPSSSVKYVYVTRWSGRAASSLRSASALRRTSRISSGGDSAPGQRFPRLIRRGSRAWTSAGRCRRSDSSLEQPASTPTTATRSTAPDAGLSFAGSARSSRWSRCGRRKPCRCPRRIRSRRAARRRRG